MQRLQDASCIQCFNCKIKTIHVFPNINSFSLSKRIISPRLATKVAKAYIPDYQSDVYNLSNQFWSIVNPEKEPAWIEVHSPSLFICDSNTAHCSLQAQSTAISLSSLYQLNHSEDRHLFTQHQYTCPHPLVMSDCHHHLDDTQMARTMVGPFVDPHIQ